MSRTDAIAPPAPETALEVSQLGEYSASQASGPGQAKNVSEGERLVSAASGSILLMLGLGRRDLTGLLIAGVGGALAYRGVTGQCSVYRALNIDTATDQNGTASSAGKSSADVSISFLINKSPEELYNFWRGYEKLPQFMTHLESVEQLADGRSRWVAKAPKLYGGHVQWDAETIEDVPNKRIAWRALPDSQIQHHGSVTFDKALGDRGTKVRVELSYQPPGGAPGRWLAKLFGEEPELQIRDDLRNFKRMMELGEVVTVSGQPRGNCVIGGGRREA